MSIIRLNKEALIHNLSVIKARIGTAEIGAVLKDNAYGHGLELVAPACAEFGVRFAVVRTAAEARSIAHLFDEVLVLADRAELLTDHNISFALNDINNSVGIGANIHIKIDSGMHRNGISVDDLPRCFEGLLKKGVKIRGVFSHLRSADVLSAEFFWQEKNFAAARKMVEELCIKKGVELPRFHLYNSAGIFRKTVADTHDLVRTGIAMYGYCDMPFLPEKPPLKPVLSLWGDRLTEQRLSAGDRVGYGGVYISEKAQTISIYDIGYGDGFLRLNGSENYATPDGKKVLGRVSMDSMAIEGSETQICI